jgi:hypothetical protein
MSGPDTLKTSGFTVCACRSQAVVDDRLCAEQTVVTGKTLHERGFRLFNRMPPARIELAHAV